MERRPPVWHSGSRPAARPNCCNRPVRLLDGPRGPCCICNGYKDQRYIETAILGPPARRQPVGDRSRPMSRSRHAFAGQPALGSSALARRAGQSSRARRHRQPRETVRWAAGPSLRLSCARPCCLMSAPCARRDLPANCACCNLSTWAARSTTIASAQTPCRKAAVGDAVSVQLGPARCSASVTSSGRGARSRNSRQASRPRQPPGRPPTDSLQELTGGKAMWVARTGGRELLRAPAACPCPALVSESGRAIRAGAWLQACWCSTCVGGPVFSGAVPPARAEGRTTDCAQLARHPARRSGRRRAAAWRPPARGRGRRAIQFKARRPSPAFRLGVPEPSTEREATTSLSPLSRMYTRIRALLARAWPASAAIPR